MIWQWVEGKGPSPWTSRSPYIHDSPLDFILRTSEEPHIYAEKDKSSTTSGKILILWQPITPAMPAREWEVWLPF